MCFYLSRYLALTMKINVQSATEERTMHLSCWLITIRLTHGCKLAFLEIFYTFEDKENWSLKKMKYKCIGLQIKMFFRCTEDLTYAYKKKLVQGLPTKQNKNGNFSSIIFSKLDICTIGLRKMLIWSQMAILLNDMDA